MSARAGQPEDPAAWAELAAEVAAHVDGIDAYEVRADQRQDRRLALRGAELIGARSVTSLGLGVQLFAHGGSAHVHTTDPSREAVRELLERGVRLARQSARAAGRSISAELGAARQVSYRPSVREHPSDASNERIAELLQRADESARAAEEATKTQTAFGARTVRAWIRASNGSRVDLESLVSTMLVTAACREDGKLGSGSARIGGERGLGDYEAEGLPEQAGRDAAQRARESLDAVALPSGRYRVLCDNELAGTLAHESFGHLTEHDLVSSGWSTLRGRLGETLAVEGVTISDAPVSPGDPHEGVAVPFDEQGTRGSKVTMLDNGVLRAWMHTRESAREEGASAAGNGRALDSRFPPIVRMRNTFFEPGRATREEALQALGDGLYLIGARGGAPHSDGSFMFTSIRGYVVKRGRIESPVRTASIHGNVLDFLKNVELLTRDFQVTTNYFGGCGKRDQSYLHVGVGGPHVLVKDALVGGI